jgi:hypothetical protein
MFACLSSIYPYLMIVDKIQLLLLSQLLCATAWLICWTSNAAFGLEGVFLHHLGRSSKCGSPKQSKLDLLGCLHFLILALDT